MSAEAVRQELIEIASLLVDEPEEVSVEEVPFRGGRMLTLHVAEDDLGIVIGRQGRTVRALRALLTLRGERDGEQYELEIAE
ncbi:MAG: KH domain-containing protein [Thermoanaerobaculia bacterium]